MYKSDVTPDTLTQIQEDLAKISFPDFNESKRTTRKKAEPIHKYKLWKHEMPSQESIEKQKNIDQDGPDFMQYRNFGATHAVRVCAADTHTSAKSQWLLDTGQLSEDEQSTDQTVYADMGHFFEDTFAQIYSTITRIEVKKTGIHQDPETPEFTVSPDRLPGLEVKTQIMGQKCLDKKGIPVPARKHIFQIFYTMELLNLKSYDLVAGFTISEKCKMKENKLIADVVGIRILHNKDLGNKIMATCKQYLKDLATDYACPGLVQRPDQKTIARSFDTNSFVYEPLFHVQFFETRIDLKLFGRADRQVMLLKCS